jgi:hypothetical protein
MLSLPQVDEAWTYGDAALPAILPFDRTIIDLVSTGLALTRLHGYQGVQSSLEEEKEYPFSLQPRGEGAEHTAFSSSEPGMRGRVPLTRSFGTTLSPLAWGEGRSGYGEGTICQPPATVVGRG